MEIPYCNFPTRFKTVEEKEEVVGKSRKTMLSEPAWKSTVFYFISFLKRVFQPLEVLNCFPEGLTNISAGVERYLKSLCVVYSCFCDMKLIVIVNEILDLCFSLNQVDSKILKNLFKSPIDTMIFVQYCVAILLFKSVNLVEADQKYQGSLVQKNVIMTYYWVNFPDDFKKSGQLTKFGSCSGEVFGKAEYKFLKNTALDGTGVWDGVLYNLSNCHCDDKFMCFEKVDKDVAPYGLTEQGGPLTPFVSVASNDIDPGIYYIPNIDGWTIPGKSIKHNGCIKVEDKSWSFGAKHIDLFVYKNKYYNIWDSLYESPRVDVYKANDCVLLDYNGNDVKLGSQLGNSNNNNGGGNTDCKCPSPPPSPTAKCDTTKIIIEGPGGTSSTIISPTPKPTSKPNALQVLHKRKAYANVESCSGYNCYPVKVIMITNIVLVLILPIICWMLRFRVPRIFSYAMTFMSMFVAGSLIYSVLALQATGPLTLQIIDTADQNGPKKRDFCQVGSRVFLITAAIGIVIGVAASIWMIFSRKTFKKGSYNNSINKICVMAYGYTLGGFGFLAYGLYEQYKWEIGTVASGKLITALFWSGISLAAVTMVFSLIHLSIQFIGIMVFLFDLDFTKPFLYIIYAILTLFTILFINMKSCY